MTPVTRPGTTRVAYVEWPEALSPASSAWNGLKSSVTAAGADILVTNELPFGRWIAEGSAYSETEAFLSLRAQEEGLERLIDLGVPAVISTRPVRHGSRLANEAFVLENGAVRPLHRKQYFPNEPGWFESEWYGTEDSGFEVSEIRGVRVGVLICTEAMFNERARAYGRDAASLIVVPRASGMNLEPWKIAAAMASLVSGAYVVSSNRVGPSRGGTTFGGGGFAYAPGGLLLGMTTPTDSLRTVAVDPAIAASARREYPCYVPERT